jgi:preprotein translocase subunit SecY
MLIGCLLPLLLIFVLPLFGVGSGVSLFIFIILMFGCHLLMMGRHGKHEHTEHEKEAGRESH